MPVELTHKQAINREKDIQDELERLKAKTDKTPEDHAAVPKLLEEFRSVHAHRLDLEHDAALAEIRSASSAGASDSEARDENRGGGGDVDIVDTTRHRGAPSLGGKYRNPWDTSEVRYGQAGTADELRHRAEDAIERMPHASQKVREASAGFVERAGDDTRMAELVLGTSSPEYAKAFFKVVRAQGQMAGLEAGEQRALSRAMSLTDANGGFAVPFQLDPTVILTADGSFNQVRQIARVVTATGDVWHGISSAGVTGSWDGEGTEVSDDSPTLAQPSIPIHKGDVFVAQSFEVEADAGLAGEIARMIAFEKDSMESVAFVTGSGSGRPTGIVTALAGTSSVITSTTTDTFAVGDVYKLDTALPARYAANGSYLGHRGIYNTMRQFDTNGGSALWGQLAEARKSELLGRPDYIAEAMKSAVTPTQDNHVLVFGDFSNYVIADRIGTTLSYIPHLFGANGRPTGQSGWFAYFRVGADSVNDGAFRMLNVT
ncbi:phage major capsid protein [Gordonia terrae]|uniref:phage major capsid protein n=1 Tax=Gordonia terrae TaxID=2055 RepID=UPI003F6B385B